MLPLVSPRRGAVDTLALLLAYDLADTFDAAEMDRGCSGCLLGCAEGIDLGEFGCCECRIFSAAAVMALGKYCAHIGFVDSLSPPL